MLLGLVAGLPAPTPATAHASLARAVPAADTVTAGVPTRVTLHFTEPLEPAFSSVRVVDSLGARVDRDDSRVDPHNRRVLSAALRPLTDGTYTVVWRNLSTVDGHALRGSFVFFVGERGAGGAPVVEQPRLFQSPAEPVLRWLVLLAALTMAGGLAVPLLIWRPAVGQHPGREHDSMPLARVDAVVARRSALLGKVAIGILAAASLVEAVLQAATVHEIAPLQTLGRPLASFLIGTVWGRWLLARLALAAVAALLAAAGDTRSSSPRRHPPVRAARLSLLLRLATVAGILATSSFTSHAAATVAVTTAAIITHYLHLAAAALWVGGLFHLAVILPAIQRGLAAEERRRVLARLVPRFSVLAILAAGTLAITGLYSSWAQVTIVPALATPYGVALLVKLALALPLLLLGAVNLLHVRPRLATDDRSGGLLRKTVSAEALVGVLILLAVGVLTSLEPGRQTAAREGLGREPPFAVQTTEDGTTVTLEVSPGRVGPNRITVVLRDRRNRPIDDAQAVRLRISFLDLDMGQRVAEAAAAGDGRYVSDDQVLSVAGQWQVALRAQRPDTFDTTAAVRFAVVPSSGSAVAFGPTAETGVLLLAAELALLGALFLSVGIGYRARGRRRPEQRTPALALMPGVAALAAAVIVLIGGELAARGDTELRNPFPPTSRSLAIGEPRYVQNCQICHGAGGRGDGPVAARYTPPPSDLVVHVPKHSDDELYSAIHDGVTGTAMPAYGGTNALSAEQIWHLINFIASFER